jgi:ubiquinone/menaquinone biosynthesis C-methylase UbiE
MKRYSKAEILRVYARHPVQQKAVLERVRTKRGTLTGLTESDLAIDDVNELTDQNHVGGFTFVEELGRRASVSPKTKVLDLGCGLGGSARVLAATFGCHVHGIDLSPKRYREAQRLTKLVGLSKWVTFECGDFMSARVPHAAYDVLWGQSSWIHVANKKRFVHRWNRALKTHGRIALEDAFLTTRTLTQAERELVSRLEEQWKSYLISGEQWRDLFVQESFTVCQQEDLTLQMLNHFKNLIEVSNMSVVPKKEAAAWKDAVRLTETGVLYYTRIVAKKATETR